MSHFWWCIKYVHNCVSFSALFDIIYFIYTFSSTVLHKMLIFSIIKQVFLLSYREHPLSYHKLIYSIKVKGNYLHIYEKK